MAISSLRVGRCCGHLSPADRDVVDTYRSQDHADDPPTPHVSIHSPPMAHHDHSLACTETGAVPALRDAPWSFEVLYIAERRQVIVSLAEAGARERSYTQLIQAEIPPGGKEWFCGVTAATGGLWQIVSSQIMSEGAR